MKKNCCQPKFRIYYELFIKLETKRIHAKYGLLLQNMDYYCKVLQNTVFLRNQKIESSKKNGKKVLKK